MLYRETTTNAFSAWTGEPVPMVLTVPVFENGVQTGSKEVQDNVSLPLNIEALWSDKALAAYGLYRPVEAMPVPDGKVSAGEHVERLEGVVRFVHDLEDIALLTFTETLCDRIDQDAENARKKYITTGDGQAMTYQRKVDQARAYLAATDPVDTDYPALLNEVGITGADCAEVATVIMTMFAAWEQIGDQIEKMRLARKKAIREAATFAEKRDAYTAAVWP